MLLHEADGRDERLSSSVSIPLSLHFLNLHHDADDYRRCKREMRKKEGKTCWSQTVVYGWCLCRMMLRNSSKTRDARKWGKKSNLLSENESEAELTSRKKNNQVLHQEAHRVSHPSSAWATPTKILVAVDRQSCLTHPLPPPPPLLISFSAAAFDCVTCCNF